MHHKTMRQTNADSIFPMHYVYNWYNMSLPKTYTRVSSSEKQCYLELSSISTWIFPGILLTIRLDYRTKHRRGYIWNDRYIKILTWDADWSSMWKTESQLCFARNPASPLPFQSFSDFLFHRMGWMNTVERDVTCFSTQHTKVSFLFGLTSTVFIIKLMHMFQNWAKRQEGGLIKHHQLLVTLLFNYWILKWLHRKVGFHTDIWPLVLDRYIKMRVIEQDPICCFTCQNTGNFTDLIFYKNV